MNSVRSAVRKMFLYVKMEDVEYYNSTLLEQKSHPEFMVPIFLLSITRKEGIVELNPYIWLQRRNYCITAPTFLW